MVATRTGPDRLSAPMPSAADLGGPQLERQAQRRAAVGEVKVAADLRSLLGTRLVAYITGVTEGRAVNEWADGRRKAGAAAMERMRIALQAAALIESLDGPEVAQAWFQGLDPTLGDRSPASVLRDGEPGSVGPRLMEAARTFVAR